MSTKLTLTLEKDVINDAKAYAKAKGTSLSEMVENYFIMLTRDTPKSPIALSPTAKALKGSLSLSDDIDYKIALREEITKKHL